MKYFQSACLAAVAAMTGVTALGRSASASVFDEVPSDALAVIEIHSIDGFNGKWDKFADATGLSQLSPDAKDPITGLLDRQGGITQGINSSGDMAAVVFHADKGKSGRFALVPVSDYKAFVANFANPQEGADGITSATAKDNRDMFIAHWGDYAAVTSRKELLAHKPEGIKLAGISADAVKSNDAVLYFNADQLRAQVLPMLKDNADQIIDRMTKQSKASPAMAKLGWTMILDHAQQFIQDVKDSVVTVNVAADGIALGGEADFLPNTPESQLAAAIKGTDQPLLTGLPDKQYLMTFGDVLSPELKQQISSAILDPLIKQLDTGDAANKPVLDALNAGKAKLAAIDTSAAGVVTPKGNPGQDSMVQIVGNITGDAPAWKKAQSAGLLAAGDLNKNPDPAAPMTLTVETKPDATTVSDVHLDQFTFKVDFHGNDPQAARAQQMIGMIYGPNGITGYLGTATDKIGVFSMDVDDQDPLLADSIAAAKSGKDVVSSAKTVQDVAAKLPSPRVAEGFVYVDQFLSLGVRIAQSFGLRANINIPADVDPIGFAVSGNGTIVQTNVFVPQALVKTIVDVVNGLHGMGGGPGHGGGNDPLPGGGQGGAPGM